MQTRLWSAIETISSTAFGFAVAWAATVAVLPLFNMAPSISDSFWITVFFTGISLLRGYAFRRIFNHVAKRLQ